MKLQMFSLIQIFISWKLIPRGPPTQLKITLSGVLSISPSDMNQLIDLLIDSPDLEELILEFCLPPLCSQVSPEQQIYLPHLSCLNLSGPTARVTNLLKTLRLRSSAKLYLPCTSKDSLTHPQPDHMILPLISVHFQNPTPVEFKSLSLMLCTRRYFVDVAASTDPLGLKIFDLPICGGVRDSKAELTLVFDNIPVSDFEESILG